MYHLKTQPLVLLKSIFESPPPSPTQLLHQLSHTLFPALTKELDDFLIVSSPKQVLSKKEKTEGEKKELETNDTPEPPTTFPKHGKIKDANNEFPSNHASWTLGPTPIFPISSLPTELRHQIYSTCISSLPALPITLDNASLPLHNLTPLATSSPFFALDIPHNFYYQNATFVFTSGNDMKTFTSLPGRRENVRNIVIEYGKEESAGRDWVFLMNECFENLEEVEFRCGSEKEMEWEKCQRCARCERRDFESWWGAVVDAVREARNVKTRKRELVLRSRMGGNGVRFVC